MQDECDPGGPRGLFLLLSEQARRTPDAPALVYGEEALTHGALERRVQRVVTALLTGGLERGDRVALLAGPSPDYVACFLGAIRAGGCAVPLPEGAAPDAIARMVGDADARVLFASRAALGALGERLPPARFALDFEAQGWTTFEALLGSGGDAAAAVPPAPDDAFDILYSSGTTGEPKGIVQSHRMRAHHVQRMGRLGLGAGCVTLIATPLCSNATWIALLPTLALGGTAVLLPSPFDTRRFLTTAQTRRATHTLLVPVQFRRLLDDPRFDSFNLGAFQAAFSTGAPFPAAWKREVLDRWPGRLVEIYGQTEGGPTTLLDARAHPTKLASVGRPAPGVELRILDAEGRVLPPGPIGEIAGSGAGMMSGYHGRPDLTAALTWRDAAGGVFYRSGDLGHVDEDGFLHLAGRVSDVIISGGQNVHAADLEEVLVAHAAAAEVAVVGAASERWGETPVAVVVPVPGSHLTADDLLAWANARLGRHQRLARVEIHAALPRTPLGKVRKDALRTALREATPPESGHAPGARYHPDEGDPVR